MQANGNLIISKGYTALQGAEVCYEFTIELLEDGGYKLAPIYYEDEADAPEAETESAAATA